jgi:hypothetical protein
MRQEDARRHLQQLPGIGDGSAVIARARRDDLRHGSAREVGGERIDGAADLERSGREHGFVLQIHGPARRRQRLGADEWGRCEVTCEQGSGERQCHAATHYRRRGRAMMVRRDTAVRSTL